MMQRAAAATRRMVSFVAAGAERAARTGLIGVVKGYRLLLSPMLGAACRFSPTCSVYALQALERHGAGRGSYLTLTRLARCHPWCEGGVDEVPAKPAAPGAGLAAARGDGASSGRLFSRLLSPSSQKNLHE